MHVTTQRENFLFCQRELRRTRPFAPGNPTPCVGGLDMKKKICAARLEAA